MYRLANGQTGPMVRIGAMREALSVRVSLDLISGTRTGRGLAMLRYALTGQLRGLNGIYVESSSSLPGPWDLAFIGLARALHIPVVSYVRDAYQLFPEYYPLTSLRRRLSRAAFLPLFRMLARISSVVAFPSRGLARAVLGDGERARSAALLPPGSRLPIVTAVDLAPRAILYVGSLAHAASGGGLLFEAMGRARERVPGLTLICVTPEDLGPGEPRPEWLEMRRGGRAEIEQLLPRVLATVTPRLRTPYNDLAVPIKVVEYLGYGRPLIVTEATETAAIVQAAGCGIVVPATVEGLANGIKTIAASSPEQLARWGDAARQWAIANSWDARAAAVLALLGLVE